MTVQVMLSCATVVCTMDETPSAMVAPKTEDKERRQSAVRFAVKMGIMPASVTGCQRFCKTKLTDA